MKAKRSEAVSRSVRWRQGLWALAMASVLLLWGYLWWDPEALPVLALLQYLPFPGYLVPVVALALWMWPMGWVWRGLACLPVLIVLGPVMGLCLGSPDEGSVHLRFMTYNVKSFLLSGVPGGYQKLTMEVAQASPDIVVMQDANYLLGMRNSHPELFQMMFEDRQIQAYGQYVIASRYPLKDCHPGMMPFQGKVHTFFTCEVTVQGQVVRVVTVHFQTPRDGLNATRFEGLKGLPAWEENMSQRLYQSAYLAEYIRQNKQPIILAGDLNAPEHSRVVQGLLAQGLRDAFSSSSIGWGYSYGHSLLKGLPFLRIDHILVSKELGVEEVTVGGMEASQHRPLVADLYLSRH